MADVTNERLDACVLHHMSFKAVRRGKPATADLTVILVVPSVNRKVPLQPTGSREMFAAFGAANIATRCVTQPGYEVLPPGELQSRLEHKHASVRNLRLARQLATSMNTLNHHTSCASEAPTGDGRTRPVASIVRRNFSTF